jgi:thioester reductase-like protein
MGKNETFFLTGFPGFIASRLVKRLARDGSHFMLLVQPTFLERARSEIKALVEETGLARENFTVLEGDITRPDLGLSPNELEEVRSKATTVFHLAAIYDLAVERDVAMRVNVGGTRNVSDFALGLPLLRRYHYVSTCYVAGKRPGLILESELEHTTGFRNYYEETKYLAELEVSALKSRIPVTIHRPSVVCGDSTTGETMKYDGVYYLILYLLKQPNLLSLINIGNDEVRLNLVPVDFVVEAIATLMHDERAVGQTVQLADPTPLTTRELFEVISKNLVGRGSVVTAPPKLVQTSLSLSVSPAITGLPKSGVPYFFIDQTYDTTIASKLLAPHGVKCPRFPEYVENLIGFVKEHPTL